MTRSRFILLAITLLLLFPACASQVDLVIRDVTVISGSGAAAMDNCTVLVKSGLIRAILPGTYDGNAARTIDGNGKFLVPGFIDAHCHPGPSGPVPFEQTSMQSIFEPMVKFGITSAVLFGGSHGSYASMEELVERSKRGDLNAPRLFHSSPIVTIEGAHPIRTYTSSRWVEGEVILVPRSLNDIDAIVAQAAEHDVIGVKIIVEDGPEPPFIQPMPTEWVRRFVEQGQQRGVPVYAHISDMAEVRSCVEAGVHAMVHFWGAEIDWSSNEDSQLIDQIIAKDISWITTLVLGKGMIYYPQHPEWLEQEALRSVFDPQLLNALRDQSQGEKARALLESWTGDANLTMAEFFAEDVASIAEAYRRGVNMVVGTDTGNDAVLPGFALHEEMEILQIGGMKPLDILRMATHNAAKMLGRLEDLGTLEEGKIADMVLLNANPAEDIRNARAIEMVFIAGIERSIQQVGH